ncbi:hypothetical protein [Aureispira anguillae]|uniref:Uncharacterized protein n=1 Tax=Aureispira anguillae TaxID=2864201 RepID=A0A916DQ21_9BACT|nr:hypothetical protein [Aureispira anguillae]BDS10476.1 hypothetical protein AsAng_0011840 [Aureispira anguillae]
MKKIILTWIVLLGVVGLTYAQAQKTLVKTLAIEKETQEAIFALTGDVEVIEWENETIRIMTTITTPNTAENVIKALVAAGRYDYKMVVDKENQTITIDMPKKDRPILINGVDLDDQLNFKIYIPQGMKYRIGTADTFMLM